MDIIDPGVTGRRRRATDNGEKDGVGIRGPPLKWLRKKSVAVRYDCTERTVDRMREQGRIPAPHFPFGNEVPAWLEHELDEHDLAAARAAASPSEAA